MLTRIGCTVLAGLAALVLAQVAHLFPFFHSMTGGQPRVAANFVTVFDADVQVEVLREVPEPVTALATYRGANRPDEDVFVGTGSSGSVFRFSPSQPPELLRAIASGLGDSIQFGTCEVNSLAVCDLNQDGTPELLAATSQIMPIGRPRLYAWSLRNHTSPLGMTKPEIESSWSHGLGAVRFANRKNVSVFSTFCGHGEIVEYQLTRETSPSGFQLEGISWRQVGQLPASGEQAVTADADNDGWIDLCVATGYSPGRAAVWIYKTDEAGIGEQPRHVIDESGRFGNVRFLVGDLEVGGTRELVAWWCSEECSGDCEMIRYRLGPEGIRERTVVVRGNADELWPRENQMALADLDHDGNLEVWFSACSGNVWRYQRDQTPPVTHVCLTPAGAGPLIASTPASGTPSSLYLGSGQSVLRLRSHGK